MKAKSINGKTPEEINIQLQQCIFDEFRPTLAIVFLSIKDHISLMQSIFTGNNIILYGVTANRVFTDEENGTDIISILLLDMNTSYFKLEYNVYEEGFAEIAANEVASKGLTYFTNPAYIISASHVQSPIDAILKGIKDAVGKEVTIIGGISSDDNLVVGGVVFTNNWKGSNGILSLIIDTDKIQLTGYAVSGWKPMGTSKTVTKSIGNRIFTINDKPALDLLIKYTGIDVNLSDDTDVFTQIGSTYPLQVHKSEGSPIMNPPLLLNKMDHSVICGMNVPQGSKVKFSLPPDFEVIESVIKNAEEVKINEAKEADAMIVFTCVGRYDAFGPLVNQELDGLQKVWNVPMAGFFSFGEFGKTPGGNSEVHGTTCSWVVLKEK